MSATSHSFPSPIDQLIQRSDELLSGGAQVLQQAKNLAAIDPLLTQEEVCNLLGICAKTLQVWRRQGRVSFSRLGYKTIRIRQSEVLEIIRRNQI